jgi:hypothetical protein
LYLRAAVPTSFCSVLAWFASLLLSSHHRLTPVVLALPPASLSGPPHRPTNPPAHLAGPPHKPTNPPHNPTNPPAHLAGPPHRPTNPPHRPTNPPEALGWSATCAD